jgi:hypothetical protein
MSLDTPSVESPQDIQVRLKPVFGVEPKFYLAVIYSLVILAVLFALLVLPGITSPGTKVRVTSSPSGAAVTFGQKSWGTTPLTAFLPEGKAPLTVSKPGFTSVTSDYASGNNLFFSLFAPRTDSVDVKLSPTSDDSVPLRYRAEIGRWALAVPFTADYRFPPLFTRFAEDARAAGWDSDRIKAFLLELRPAVADPQMYLDYGRALGLWSEQVPDGMEAQFRIWEPLVGSGSGRLALWLLANQIKPVRDRETAEPSDWFQARLAEFQTSLKPPSPLPPAAPASLKTSWGTFRGVPASWLLWGSSGTTFPMPTEPPFSLPVPGNTAAFWIADAEVTQSQFAAFISANPRWASSNREALTASGSADSDYLKEWTDGKPAAPNDPVVSVSWYAAQAYVDWINASGRIAGGKKVVLPDDFQWEAAARAPNGASLLNQGVWEWTASAWYPGQSLVWSSTPEADKALSYARSLKGGLQNAKGSVKVGDRAGWPAGETSPGLGFRLALVNVP